ncbi:MAG TPA: substrate-binding domain-containing protein [Rhodanobacteraceae bacterium]
MHLRLRPLLAAAALTLVAHAALAGVPQLVWRGDVTTANAFVDGMAKAWHHAGHPRITLQPFNTVSGIDAVAHGTADIAGSVRGRAPLRSDEAHLVFTPVAWDALVIITNRHNPVDNLTLKQLHDIYYGLITNWDQVGGPDLPIHAYADASPTDGIEFSLRRLLFGRGNQPVAAPRLYLNVDALEQAVGLDAQSLAVTTLSDAYNHPRLKMLSINGTRPDTANIANGSYPLYTPLYLVTRPPGSNAAKAARIRQFVAFAQSPKVAAIMRRHHLVPYADALALAGHDAERIAAIARQTGRHVIHHNGPTAAPMATYSSRAAIAPTSKRTLRAYQRMMAQRQADAAAKLRKGDARSTPVPSKISWYTVTAGDTLPKIAQAHAVSVEQLRTWNHLTDDHIHVGQKLAIHHD